MIEIRDESAAVEVRIGEGVYKLRPTFDTMWAVASLQDQSAELGESPDPKAQLALLHTMRDLVTSGSDIPAAVLGKLTLAELRQLIGVLAGNVGEAKEPGKN